MLHHVRSAASGRARLGLAFGALALLGCSVDVEDLFGDGAANSGGDSPTGGAAAGAGNPAGAGGAGAGNPQGGGGPGGQSQGGQGQGGGAASCGDGSAQLGEECDGADLNGASCTTFGYSKPTGLACGAACTFDTSGCKATCGDNAVEPGEGCDDGNTAPNDGCSPQCQVQGPSCQTAAEVPLALGTTVLSGTTAGASLESPEAAFGCTDALGPEVVFKVVPASAGYLTAWLPRAQTAFDSVLYARPSCDPNGQIACHDNFGGNDQGGDVISFPVAAGAPVFVFVDGFQAADAGDFQLSLDLSSGDACGDPVPIVVEGQADITLLGDTSILANDVASNFQCGGAGGGADAVYAVSVAQGGAYTFDVSPGFNSVLHARTTCASPDTQLTCSNPGGNAASMTIDLNGNGSAFVFMDGTSNQAGPYQLVLSH